MKRISLLILLCAVLFSLAFPVGCSSRSIAADDLMRSIHPASSDTGTEPLPVAFTDAMTSFGWNLLRQTASDTGGNLLIAPASVHLALSMTLNGAETETFDEMKTLLSDPDLSMNAHNRAARTLLERWKEKRSPLTVVNSLWFDDSLEPKPDFLQKNADFYNAAAWQLDLQGPDAADTINSWVADTTDGIIQHLIQDIPSEAALYLVNALTLSADWVTPFDPTYTHAGTFNSPDGPVSVPFMNRIGPITHTNEDGCVSILLPYKGGSYAFFAMLPPEGRTPRDLLEDERSIPETQLRLLLDAPATTEIALALPSFTAESDWNLADNLSRLGMPTAFLPEQADFFRIAGNLPERLYIDRVLHKTCIKVDEEGTEAAAGTAVELMYAGLTDGLFNRPFLYGVLDTETGIPLFLGILERPDPAS